MSFDIRAALRAALAEEMSMMWDDFRKLGGRQHPRSECRATHKAGGPAHCVIHNPSKHSMRDWPLILRSSGLLERQCPHGVGHPDPDSAAYMDWRDKTNAWSWHGCHLNDSGQLCHGTEEEEK
jgi:hypothetical protein